MPDTVPGDVFRRLSDRAAQLAYLVGAVIEALEFYDTNDGHNELVRAGIASELKRIEGAYEQPPAVDAVGEASR